MNTSGVPKCFIGENCVGLKPSIVRWSFNRENDAAPLLGPLFFKRKCHQQHQVSLSLWKPKCRRSGFAAQRPRGMWSSIGIPQLLHTHQRISCKLPSHKFFWLPAATFSITNRSKNKKKDQKGFLKRNSMCHNRYCQLFAPSLQKWPPPFSWSLLVRCSHVRVVPMRLVVHQGSRWS